MPASLDALKKHGRGDPGVQRIKPGSKRYRAEQIVGKGVADTMSDDSIEHLLTGEFPKGSDRAFAKDRN